MTNNAEWAGPVGAAWARQWQRTDRSFAPLTEQLIPAILTQAPEIGRAVDIGCGAGETSIGIAKARPSMSVTGLDISEELLVTARERSADMVNLDFASGDAVTAVAPLDPVELYFSRHGVMFFDDPVAAFSAFRSAAVSNASIVFSCFRDWKLNSFAYDVIDLVGSEIPDDDAPGPFAFASEEKVRRILEESGWSDVVAKPVDFDYIAGAGDDPVEDALSFLQQIGPAARAIRRASADERPALLAKLETLCQKRQQGSTVLFPSAAWIWTARA